MTLKTLCSILVFFFLPAILFAQQFDSSDVFAYKKNIFLSLLFPKGIAEGVALRSYLRSNSWDTLQQSLSDREAFDEIFLDADELCYDKKPAALLAASVAVLEHKTIPFKFLFGAIIDIPLTLESQKDFDKRVSQLPSHIYDPKIPDTDKLQHFFFSAFFMKILKMKPLVRLLGNGVEIGEDLFVEGGSNDIRDKHANDDGIRFGERCEEDGNTFLLPSQSLTPNPQ